MSTKLRNKVKCECKACNGKLVEERTRNKHTELENRLASNVSGFVPSNPFFLTNPNPTPYQHIAMEIDDPIIEGSPSRRIDNPGSSRMEAESEESSDDNNYEPVAADFDQYTSQKRRR